MAWVAGTIVCPGCGKLVGYNRDLILFDHLPGESFHCKRARKKWWREVLAENKRRLEGPLSPEEEADWKRFETLYRNRLKGKGGLLSPLQKRRIIFKHSSGWRKELIGRAKKEKRELTLSEIHKLFGPDVPLPTKQKK